MLRIGELLVADGVLTLEQVEQALRAQVMWGARFGTNLIELGLIDLDQLSTYLARQHDMPAALARHFERGDAELQQQLSPSLAELHACVPLLRAGRDRSIIIASTSPPTRKASLRIAEAFGVPPESMVWAIAAELRVRYQLERLYQIARPARFMRTPGDGIPRVPQIEEFEDESDVENRIAPTAPLPEPVVDGEDDLSIPIAADHRPPSLDELASDPGRTATLAEDDETARARRRYVRLIAEDSDAAPALARISIRRVAAGAEEPSGIGNTLSDATRAIRRATDRDRVGDLCMETLHRFAKTCDAATLLVIRGKIATSWKGFCRSGEPHAEVTLPLDQDGLIPRAVELEGAARGPSADVGPIDLLLMRSLGHAPEAERDLVVVPVTVSHQAVCVLALVTEVDAPCGTAETIAAAVGSAFARLMRNASR